MQLKDTSPHSFCWLCGEQWIHIHGFWRLHDYFACIFFSLSPFLFLNLVNLHVCVLGASWENMLAQLQIRARENQLWLGEIPRAWILCYYHRLSSWRCGCCCFHIWNMCFFYYWVFPWYLLFHLARFCVIMCLLSGIFYL